MSQRSNYSLVAQDLLMFTFGRNGQEVKDFSTDDGNDTAIYFVNNTALCKELFTTTYTVNGTHSYETKRIYERDANFDVNGAASSVFVVFGGFQYGISSNFSFDPVIITPNSATSSGSTLSIGNLLPYIGIVAAIIIIGSVAVWFRRKK